LLSVSLCVLCHRAPGRIGGAVQDTPLLVKQGISLRPITAAAETRHLASNASTLFGFLGESRFSRTTSAGCAAVSRSFKRRVLNLTRSPAHRAVTRQRQDGFAWFRAT
jgi:hypothetical protein